MRAIAGVRFERAGRVHYFVSGGLDIRLNDYVVAKERSEERIGRVVFSPGQLIVDQLGAPVTEILRKATPEDLESAETSWTRP